MNKRTEKRQNLAQLLAVLRRYGPLTQARIKEYCELQASTVSYLVNDLKSVDLIRTVGQELQEGKVGKPGNVICLNNEHASFLGLYVEDDWIDTYRIGIDGTTLSAAHVDFDGQSVKEAVISAVASELEQFPQIKGVGIAIKGIVRRDGTIKSGWRHGSGTEKSFWNFTGLQEALTQAFPHIPMIVENDANCAAELYHYNVRREQKDLVLYLLNQIPFGIGCGLLLNGAIYRGSAGAAGEIFEKGAKFIEYADQLKRGEASAEQFLPAIIPHMMETAYLLDPECIVLAGSYLNDRTPEELEKLKTLWDSVPVPVVIAGGDARLDPAKGAALLVTDKYIEATIEEVMQG